MGVAAVGSWVGFAVLGVVPAVGAQVGDGDTPSIPALAWEARSDWVDVRSMGAKADGAADDSDAIQRALDGASDGSTVYFPAGSYRITRTLTHTGRRTGLLLVGHGRDTRLVWDGAEGGRMMQVDGVTGSRFVGLFFDGRNRAAVGFCHHSTTAFETEVRHQHLGFANLTDAGVMTASDDKYALAETTFENCLFENCRRGVAFLSFNDFNFTFDGCEFRDCETGIECRHGNFYARNTHFRNSRAADILAMPEHGCSVRRCTSSGSRRFVELKNQVTPMTIQDCQVEGWTHPDGAVSLGGGPVILMDCGFGGGPKRNPPVEIVRKGQRVIVSGNQARGASDLIREGHAGMVLEVPDGKRKGCLASAGRRFLKGEVPVPAKVFDARRDFGAVGDGKADDTVALRRCIDAARGHGGGALAYLPTGRYVIAETLRIEGADYGVGGSGWCTRLIWRGAEGGTMIEVRDPGRVRLEHIAVGNHDSGKMNNGIDILQTGTGAPSHMIYDGVFVYGMYQMQPLHKGLQLRGLGANAVVLMPHVQGNLRFTDCAGATILAGMTIQGSVVVDGKDPRRDGLLGFQTRLATAVTHVLYLRDNHSIVMSDMYVENANNGWVFEGGPGLPPGRATIQGAKVHFKGEATDPAWGTSMAIDNYEGQIFFGHDQFSRQPPDVRIVQAGERPLELFLVGNCFYGSRPEPKVGPMARVHYFGNEGIPALEGIGPKDADGDLLRKALTGIAEGLDDLRRLGEADLRLNHGASRIPFPGAPRARPR